MYAVLQDKTIRSCELNFLHIPWQADSLSVQLFGPLGAVMVVVRGWCSFPPFQWHLNALSLECGNSVDPLRTFRLLSVGFTALSTSHCQCRQKPSTYNMSIVASREGRGDFSLSSWGWDVLMGDFAFPWFTWIKGSGRPKSNVELANLVMDSLLHKVQGAIDNLGWLGQRKSTFSLCHYMPVFLSHTHEF